jgi:hypothetical protein
MCKWARKLKAFPSKNLDYITKDIRIAKVINSLGKVTKKVAKKLNKNKIDYIIIGGQAVLLYGEPRH